MKLNPPSATHVQYGRKRRGPARNAELATNLALRLQTRKSEPYAFLNRPNAPLQPINEAERDLRMGKVRQKSIKRLVSAREGRARLFCCLRTVDMHPPASRLVVIETLINRADSS